MTDYFQQFIGSISVLAPLTDSWSFWTKHNKNDLEKYRLAIEAILVQQSNWKNVERACNNLQSYCSHQNPKICSWDYLWYSDVDLEFLQTLIKPTGFYKQKSLYLKDLARHWPDIINKTSCNERRKALLAVKGIGEETADAILLYAFEELTFLIDAFTVRIIRRTLWFSESSPKIITNYNVLKNLFLTKGLNPILNDVEWFQWLHAYLVIIGQEFCLHKNPKCVLCPLQPFCYFGRSISRVCMS